MGRELAPEEDALLVEELLIEQVVGLVGLAEGIEARVGNLLHTRADLLRRESMAVTKEVLVFAGAIDEDGGAVETETVITRRRTVGHGGCASTVGHGGAGDGPLDAADAEGRA